MKFLEFVLLPFVKVWHIVLLWATCLAGAFFTLYRLAPFTHTLSAFIRTAIAVFVGWLFVAVFGNLSMFEGPHHKITVPLMGLAVLCLVCISIGTYFPAAGIWLARQQRDSAKSARAADIVKAEPFDCNKDNVRDLAFYGRDEATGEILNLIYVDRDLINGRVVCYRGSAFNPLTGTPLSAPSKVVIQEIGKQEPLKPSPTPPPVIVAVVPSPPPAGGPAPQATPMSLLDPAPTPEPEKAKVREAEVPPSPEPTLESERPPAPNIAEKYRSPDRAPAQRYPIGEFCKRHPRDWRCQPR